ncbi:NUDIX domain-containing protein [Pseudonocardia sp. NPDC049154]|uniref:NUDIX domain-containing protein n=1 Tax=Pseudonocardia sp. NPDC049154 TaxID=3155501 RepID=UPI00340AD732
MPQEAASHDVAGTTATEVRAAFTGRPEGRSTRPVVRDSVLVAVLLALVDRPDGLHVVLGDPAPGDPGSVLPRGTLRPRETVEGAALRAARTAAGLEPTSVEIVGSLDVIATPTGFLIRPFVGLVDGPGRSRGLRTVPLAELAVEDRRNGEDGSAAAIAARLVEVLRAARPQPPTG